ncbi:hypothetical protein D918_06856 [Trichuris suis]|nr:hypothetical protein D918_06856 [Trichuris suis]
MLVFKARRIIQKLRVHPSNKDNALMDLIDNHINVFTLAKRDSKDTHPLNQRNQVLLLQDQEKFSNSRLRKTMQC